MLVHATFFGGFDIIFILFYWPFSAIGVDHYYANSIVNGIFCILLYKTLRNLNAPSIVILLIFINYYIFVLMIPAERSKVSFIFILLALTSFGKSSYKYIILSVASHLQAIFIVAAYFLSLQVNFIKRLIKGFVGINGLKMAFIFFLPLFFLMIYFYPMITHKLNFYSLNIADFFKSLLLVVVSLFFAKKKLTMLAAIVPLFIGVLILGGESRLFLIWFFVMLYILLKQGLLFAKIFYFFLGYYVFKSYFFVSNIIHHGHGFS